jgi:ribosome biogenesis GTPase A
MHSLDALLSRAATSVRNVNPAQREILERLNKLKARLEEGLLRVAVLGQFKRGKSTLVNALLGTAVLPTGITPITAIPTFIRAAAQTSARVSFAGGKEPIICAVPEDIPRVLEHYVSETENPRNRLNVERVEIGVHSELLNQGIMLVDTPGIGSTFLHNTRTAEAALSECDAAIFVVSADPPITEAEVGYLGKVRGLLPKIIFVLNKIDLLDKRERDVSRRFLADVLAQQPRALPDRIFCISARQALKARQLGVSESFAESGLADLEQVLAGDLARQKRGLLEATGRQRAAALIGELLFQSELEHKALLLPAEDLKRKAHIFEQSVGSFESERQTLADSMALDRTRLLKALDADTDRLWNDAQSVVGRLIDAIECRSKDERRARQEIAVALSNHFERALGEFTRAFREKSGERLATHQERAGELINRVRRTAADLMEISVTLPQSEEAFELKREPYWVAPEPAVSLIGISAGALAHMLPKAVREKQKRRRLRADSEAAVLRNVANLDWAIRQNVDDAFRRFETSLDEQLSRALEATRQALRIAIERRSSRAEETAADIKESTRGIAELSAILAEIQQAGTTA